MAASLSLNLEPASHIEYNVFLTAQKAKTQRERGRRDLSPTL